MVSVRTRVLLVSVAHGARSINVARVSALTGTVRMACSIVSDGSARMAAPMQSRTGGPFLVTSVPLTVATHS